jgi:hypothetical protein
MGKLDLLKISDPPKLSKRLLVTAVSIPIFEILTTSTWQSYFQTV